MARNSGKGLLRDRRGTVVILVALCLVVLVGFGAFAVDASYLYLLRNRLQSTADASALAGASQLFVTEAAVKAEAVAYAEKNMPNAVHGTVLVDPDVVLGHWDMPTRTFIPLGTIAAPGEACSNVVPLETNPNCLALDAVEATTRRDQVNGNPVPLFLARVLGFNETDIVTAAVAWGEGGGDDNCFRNGVVAGRQVLSGSTNQLFDGFCVHGEEGVKVGSQNNFTGGTEISMPDLTMLEAGSDNLGLDDALYERSLVPELAERVGELMDEVELELPALPDYIDTISFSLPSNADDGPLTPWGVEGTAYIISGKVDITSQRILNNVVIISAGDVSIGSDYVITNAIIAARPGDGTGRIQLGSYGKLGNDQYCATGASTVELMAIENILMGSNTDMYGGMLIAGVDADLGSVEINLTGVGIQAARDIKLGSDLQMTGCLSNFQNRYTIGGAVIVRLVD